MDYSLTRSTDKRYALLFRGPEMYYCSSLLALKKFGKNWDENECAKTILKYDSSSGSVCS